MPDPVRRLFLDIETSYIRVGVFALNSKSNAYISHKQILPDGDAKIICACWKWAGERKVLSSEWTKGDQCDKRVVKTLISEMDTATEIVMQNGDRFDLRWIRGRALYHRLPMKANYPTLDTLKKSKKQFYLPSYRLDFLGNHLLGENKLPTEFKLWMDIVEHNSPAGMKRMIRYCAQDVRMLEKLFDRIAPYIDPITSVAEYRGDCPWCGGKKLKMNGTRRRASGILYQDLKCWDCGKQNSLPEGQYLKNLERRDGSV